MSDAEKAQRDDDAFRDKLLGTTCWCGAKRTPEKLALTNATDPADATVARMEVTLQRGCEPLRCLAHGYCECHLTPVAAQMTPEDKERIMKRCGLEISTPEGVRFGAVCVHSMPLDMPCASCARRAMDGA